MRFRSLLHRACWLLVPLVVLSAGCDDDDPAASDPNFCYGIVFSEYLPTDENGDITGTGGEDQWCYPGNGADPFLPQLYPAYPNPFYPAVTISFVLPEAMPVRIRFLDEDCRVVRTLIDQEWIADFSVMMWNGLDDEGEQAPDGIYACVLTAGGFTCHGNVFLDSTGATR